MSDTAAVLLTADDGQGETLLLADPSQLQKKMLILSDPHNGTVRMMVDREIYLADHSVVIGDPKTPTEDPGKRRRFRKGR
jgi:hypothetical protein